MMQTSKITLEGDLQAVQTFRAMVKRKQSELLESIGKYESQKVELKTFVRA